MITEFAGGIVPAYQGIVGPFDADLEQGLAIAVDTYEREMDAFHPHFALDGVFGYLDKANKYIENTAPWALAKDPAKKAELDSVLCHLAEAIRQATILLQIVLLNAPGKVKSQLGLSDAQLDYSTVRQFGISSGNSVTKGDNLYPRLDSTIEVEYIAASMQGK
jgi:methionyl-tRNA synthetase